MVLALLLMYWKLGVPALIGGLFVILAGPVMYFIGVAMSVVQKKGLVSWCTFIADFRLYIPHFLYSVTWLNLK